jgi:predicted DNA-binding transcriptional regulator AlpA
MNQHTKYISDQQLAARYSVSRSTIWRWTAQGRLPKPFQLSDCCTRWSLTAVEKRDAEREGATA